MRDFANNIARTVLVLCMGLAVTLLAGQGASAQEPDRPPSETKADSAEVTAIDMPDIESTMEAMMGMSDQMYRRMAEVMLTVTLETLSKQETAEQLATFARNYYEALISKGFSEQEALSIVASVGVPLSPMTN